MVVGDIDVDATEALIKKMFADIPAQPNGAKREYYPVNDNKEPIILVARDKEQPYVQTFIFNKHETTPVRGEKQRGLSDARLCSNTDYQHVECTSERIAPGS